ncbi:Saposin B domain-containing protein isoform 3 [Schistosoma japonicum]|uniref:Saposin B domain-containing protein isoform 3 n=1 Tax=Schistosoma japonicum TaxID=6182 RepID=A0A4Z2DDU3_SCHJA|nr:Saposin B domain-containing protein isoform 3 [Schistosoma japonicum]TNN14576.1 Saposin B domain-containing protein isoform 3 [Schistosoma japonicum]TNN14579.1 Saposin B domain-containing protein isoform 3 [Schistosoma japonicum]
MLKRLFILIVILGVNEVTLGLENSVSPLKQPNCRLLCGTCLCLARITQRFLEFEPFIPITSEIISPLCHLIPKEEWKNKCLDVTDNLPEKIIQFAKHMNILDECSKLGMCHKNHSMMSNFEFTSFLKEHMNYWLSLDQNGKCKNTFIMNLCKHHAADTDKCIETLETIVKFLVQFTT